MHPCQNNTWLNRLLIRVFKAAPTYTHCWHSRPNEFRKIPPCEETSLVGVRRCCHCGSSEFSLHNQHNQYNQYVIELQNCRENNGHDHNRT